MGPSLPAQENITQENADIKPCHELDYNSRPQFLSVRSLISYCVINTSNIHQTRIVNTFVLIFT